MERRVPPNSSNFIKDVVDAVKMTPGDWGSLTQLFFDNLSTLLGALFAIQDMRNFGVPIEAINEIVWVRIVPGVGLTLIIGNAYYSWQASRLTNRWGRQYTAQPYGLNTPAAFAFVFNIMYPVYFILSGSGVDPAEAFKTSYDVALAANFITGIISTVLAPFGPYILKYVPPGALLVPIAGIGIAFLSMAQVTASLAAPIVGYNTILWVFLGWYAGVRVGYGKIRIPEALMVILVGVALGWATGLNQAEDVENALDLVKWHGPNWSAGELFANFDKVADYLGTVIPLGIAATAGTLMCLVSAKNAGDPYPITETMVADGIGTMVASFFGSPFGTVVYIGHPAHKRSGAKTGYSLMNGAIYLVLSWFGVLALFQSIVNTATIGPIVLFVGLMINEEALNFMPARHYSAYIIGLFPSIFDWVTNAANLAPVGDDEIGNINHPGTLGGWAGILVWKRGAVLVSFVWVSILVYVIDRQWLKASLWSSIGCVFAITGIIHMPQAGFDSFTSPVWEQCNSTEDGPVCWDHAQQWMFVVAYAMLAGQCGLIEFCRRNGYDSQLLDPLQDETADEFSDWFRDADKVVASRTKSWRDEVAEKEAALMMMDEAPMEKAPSRVATPPPVAGTPVVDEEDGILDEEEESEMAAEA